MIKKICRYCHWAYNVTPSGRISRSTFVMCLAYRQLMNQRLDGCQGFCPKPKHGEIMRTT